MIQYDFDLNGVQITIPENCILKFDGGSLSNGIINCNNTIIQADPYNIFTNIEVRGTHSSGANIEWFFRDKDEFYNNAFKDAITYFSTINFISEKEYIFDKSVIDCCHLINPYILNGNNCKFYDFSLAYNITKDNNMTPNSTSLLASLGTSIRDISFYRKNHYEYLQYPALIVSHKIEVKNCKNENPSNSSISSTYVYDIEREGDLTYPEDKEECIAYGMSTSPNRLIWGDYETTEPLKFTDYITIHSGHNMLAEFYYKTDNIGYINSYILIFKKDKVTEQVYKTYIRVTKELLNSIHGVNNLLIELTYTVSLILELKELLHKNHFLVKVFNRVFLIFAPISKL